MNPKAWDEIAEVCHHSNSDVRFKLCATCERAIDPTHRHSAAVSTDAAMVYLFCTPACRDEWIADDAENN